MNHRRKLVLALGAGALCAPFGAHAQQPGKVWRIGYLSVYRSKVDPRPAVFKQQLQKLGYVEGKTFSVDYLSAEGKYESLPSLAAELVRRNVDVIVTDGGTPTVTAAKNATRTIPIVFIGVGDPAGQGIVASLARPGGNITGMTNQSNDLAGRTVALFKEVIPSAQRISILVNPDNPSFKLWHGNVQAAANKLGLASVTLNVKSPADFESTFAEIVRVRPAGLFIINDSMFLTEAPRLTALAAKHRLPLISGHQIFSENGGLMSYGANRLDLVRGAAVQVDKIFKGAKPADLPVEQPTVFELVINMKTAKSLGIKIPQSLMISADRIIE